MSMPERPEYVEDDHLKYLDLLRESGIANMFDAGTYLQKTFELCEDEARGILTYWTKTFGKEGR